MGKISWFSEKVNSAKKVKCETVPATNIYTQYKLDKHAFPSLFYTPLFFCDFAFGHAQAFLQIVSLLFVLHQTQQTWNIIIKIIINLF